MEIDRDQDSEKAKIEIYRNLNEQVVDHKEDGDKQSKDTPSMEIDNKDKESRVSSDENDRSSIDSLENDRKRRYVKDKKRYVKDKKRYYSDSDSDSEPRQRQEERYRKRSRERYKDRYQDERRDKHKEMNRDRYHERYRDSYQEKNRDRYVDKKYKGRYYEYDSDDSYEEQRKNYRYKERNRKRNHRKYSDDEKHSRGDRKNYGRDHGKDQRLSPSANGIKIKGRGAKCEQGLRSWDDKYVKTSNNEKEVLEENYKINEDWISNRLKDVQNKFRSKINKFPKWTHDRFERINRESDSDISSERAVRMSPPLISES